jgi:hypothetical protein
MGWPEGHRQAGRGVTHPGRNLPGQTRALLDHQDVVALPARTPMNAEPLTLKRMPRILDPGGLRTVC